ncbi:MAG: ABC transporter ATP-binding protein [Silvanigrellales bacterium]|nr:ABC transporter ATP-binding protein [Silvanigrellales bacterium]
MRLSSLERREALSLFLKCFAAALLTLIVVEAPRRILSPAVTLWEGFLAASVFLVASLLASVLTYRAEVGGARLAGSLTGNLVSRIEEKYGRLHPLARQRFGAGALKSFLSSDVGNVSRAVQQVALNGLPALTLSFVCIPFIVARLGWLGVFGLVLLFSQLLFAHVLSKGIARLDGAGRESFDALLSLAGEWLRNMRLVRSLGWSHAVEFRMDAHLRAHLRAGAKSHVLLCLVFGTSFSWWMVPLAGMLLVSVWTGQQPNISSLFQASWLLSALSKYTMHLPNTLARWTQARVSLKRLAGFFAAEETLVFEEAGSKGVPHSEWQPEALEAVVFEDVEVEVEGRVLLHLPWLVVPLRRKTVVVGTVGAGKSIFVDLLMGRLPPSRGRVAVRDVQGGLHPLDVGGARRALHSRLAFVEQVPFLSSDTVAFNVALEEFGNHTVIDGETHSVTDRATDIFQSLQRAEFEADLHALPQGIFTHVGETGINLSGGQRQRINLARAFFAQRAPRSFGVFDDPLSAVDGHTEERLLATLKEWPGGFLLVTHRLSGAAAFDHVIVLEAGRLVEEGSPSGLLAEPSSRFVAFTRTREVLA